MTKLSTKTKKTATAQDRGVTAQLKCILGACTHAPSSKTCLYWNKIVDSNDPAAAQLVLIEKIIKGIKGGKKV